jgi:1,4-dihydroxy-2-naphthoate octaprenyltransferase
MWKQIVFIILLLLFLILTIWQHSWWILSIGLSVSGVLGYIGRTFNLSWTPTAQIILLTGFLVFSVTQIIITKLDKNYLYLQLQAEKQKIIELENSRYGRPEDN